MDANIVLGCTSTLPRCPQASCSVVAFPNTKGFQKKYASSKPGIIFIFILLKPAIGFCTRNRTHLG